MRSNKHHSGFGASWGVDVDEFEPLGFLEPDGFHGVELKQ
jgi:hypothetical protein